MFWLHSAEEVIIKPTHYNSLSKDFNPRKENRLVRRFRVGFIDVGFSRPQNISFLISRLLLDKACLFQGLRRAKFRLFETAKILSLLRARNVLSLAEEIETPTVLRKHSKLRDVHNLITQRVVFDRTLPLLVLVNQNNFTDIIAINYFFKKQLFVDTKVSFTYK